MLDAGKYKHKITIYELLETRDSFGIPTITENIILSPYANVKTTKGFTLIANNSDFEKAFTNFTIRYSITVENAYYNASNSNRDLLVHFKNKDYRVEYLNNIDESNTEIEMQCKEILK